MRYKVTGYLSATVEVEAADEDDAIDKANAKLRSATRCCCFDDYEVAVLHGGADNG